MPYYLERFANSARPVIGYGPGNIKLSGSVYQDFCDVMSYRSRPHPAAVSTRELTDIEVDPYAYFIADVNQRRYQARLAERGLPQTGSPDRGHAFYKAGTRRGGNFYTGAQVYVPTGALSLAVVNNFLVPGSNSNLNEIHDGDLIRPPSYSGAGLAQFGQTAYARSAPTAVVFDAAQFLGELREGLPSLVLSSLSGKAKFFKGLGNDYLNVQFGWIPFVKDIQNAIAVLTSTTQSLSSSTGKRVHRKYSIPRITNFGSANTSGSFLSVQSVFDEKAGHGYPEGSGPGLSVNGDLVYTKTSSTDRWFEGEFTSFLPLGFDPSDYLQRAEAMTKVKWTPSTLWELSPWSWLTDWYLKIGDTIAANETAANDRLIMHYGYAMERKVDTVQFHWTWSSNTKTYSQFHGSPDPKKVGGFVSYERKSRIRANPYGFRVGGLGGLSASQIAILGALGLSKGVK